MNRYQYLNGNGEHVHQLDGQPLIGTSRVGGILAKPLTYWASGLAVQTFGVPDYKVLGRIKTGKATLREKADHMAALEAALKVIKGSTVEQYAALIDKAYRAHATTLKEKATAGTDLHAELERFVKDRMDITDDTVLPNVMYDEKIYPFIAWSHDNVKRFLWAEGHCYSEKHWLGGICDVGYEKHDGTYGIGDFKSAKGAYFEHFTQIAGYHIQIEENGVLDSDGNQIYALEKPVTEYIVVPFGAPKVEPQPHVDQAGLRDTFLHMLAVYKAMPKPE
jgi:hypothetical protein